MFCGKCGNNVPDGAVVCPACGAHTGAAPAPGAKKPNKNLIAGIVGVVVVIALVIVLISSCVAGRPESMAEDLVDAMFSGSGEDMWYAVNMDKYLDLLVESGQIYKDEADQIKDWKIDFYDSTCEWIQDACEEQCGKDWSYEIEVPKVKELKNSDIHSFEKYINDDYSDLEVTEGLAVTVKVTVTGDEGYDFQEYITEFSKVDGEWIMDPTFVNNLY